MTAYTFYLHEDQDVIPSFEIALFDTVDPALDHGKRLLQDRPRYKFVEITADDSSVACVTRESL